MMKYLSTLLLIALSLLPVLCLSQEKIPAKNVEAILYLGSGANQPLLVGLGGSEGGNAWAGDHWKKTRDEFIANGYAFLAIGYFGCEGTPPILDKIAIDEVHDAILAAAKDRKIDRSKIAVIGGSRGADLALLLGSYYDDIRCVIGMSASHAVFPGHTQEFNSSCWTFEGKELPFIPVNDEAVPFLFKRDLRGAFEAMLKDADAEARSLIKAENINGPVLLLSGTIDDIIPAVMMGDKMMARLKAHNFKHLYQHIIYNGGHAEPTRHFDTIIDFLNTHFLLK
ncbi:acyl-CoA thioester hydrolase/BAAT C-terminal domain-containing protein [uncultured Flavobacterium sp.]|uniref:acyl-CoA thioester hydrolase/BAAT C-terminal domain-containing protein n=1 Tax=uncultured Flavobacterium sp. TaxID=165435 RepID=UPI0025DC990C|nr:acyl-CoA thioester hydrolase/BAAT C-terminal domain-containing protein [uncultured Flavobacterium sp.]